METLAQLRRNTERLSKVQKNGKAFYGNISRNAGEVNIFDLKVSSSVKKTVETLVFKAKSHALTDGKSVFWDITIELYPTQEHFNVYKLPELDTDCWVSCTCPYFLFSCEYACAKAGSSGIEHSNGRKAVVRNPSSVPFLCKHLYAGSTKAIEAMLKLSKSSSNKKYKFV